MSLADALGAVDPQGIVTGLVAQQAPELAQNDTVDPQSILNHLIRKGLSGDQQRQLQQHQEQQQSPQGPPPLAPGEQPDFRAYGKPVNPSAGEAATNAEQPDFSQFGQTVEEKAKPAQTEGAIKTAAEAGVAAPVSLLGGVMKDAGLLMSGATPASADVPYVPGLSESLDQSTTPPPDATKSGLYKAGENVQEFAKTKLGPTEAAQQAHPWAAAAGGGIGGVLPAAAISLVDPVVGIAGAAALFGASSAGDTYAEAKEKGADEVTARKAAALSGAANAALGAIPVATVIKPLTKFAPEASGWAMKALAQAAENGVTFASVGEAQEYVGKWIAQNYDPKAEYKFDVNRVIGDMLAGAVLGGIHGAFAKPEERPPEVRVDTTSDRTGGTGAGIGGPGPGPGPGGGDGGAGGAGEAGPGAAGGAPPPPFESTMRPKARSKLEETAGYYKEFSPDIIKSWSDEDLKNYVNDKFGRGSHADDVQEGRADANTKGPGYKAPDAPFRGGGVEHPPQYDGFGHWGTTPDGQRTWYQQTGPDTFHYANPKPEWQKKTASGEWMNGKPGEAGPTMTADEAEQTLRKFGYDDDTLAKMGHDGRIRTADMLRKAYPNGPPGTRKNPATEETVDQAAARARQDYTPAQGEANNIQRGHVDWNGIPVTIEVPAGGTRRGTDPKTGEPWETTHTDPYGYVKGTEGADGMEVDFHIGPNPRAPNVYVLDEKDNQGGQFRQHKAFGGYDNPGQALRAYLGVSTKRPENVGGMRVMPVDEFKQWLKTGDTTAPISDKMTGAQAGESAGAVGGFTTAKGSTYEVHDDSTTTRNKAYRPEHGEAEQGPQPRSEKTYYVSPQDANRLAPPQGRFQLKEGPKGLSLLTPAKGGGWGISPEQRDVPHHPAPAVGLIPVESWKGGKKVHFGNPITEVRQGVSQASPGTPADNNNVAEATHGHVQAVETALQGAGVPPDAVRPADIQTAAEIHATTGMTPGDAFQAAVVANAINDVELDKRDAEDIYGHEEIATVLDASATSGGVPSVEASGAGAGGETAPHQTGQGELVSGGGEGGGEGHAGTGHANAEAEHGAPAHGVGTENAEPARGENAAGTGDHTTGGERVPESNGGRTGGEGAGEPEHEHAGHAAEAAVKSEEETNKPVDQEVAGEEAGGVPDETRPSPEVQRILDVAKKKPGLARLLRTMQGGENFEDAARENYAAIMKLIGDKKLFPTKPTAKHFDEAAELFGKKAEPPKAGTVTEETAEPATAPTGAPPPSATGTAAVEETAKQEMLQDVGEKIGGARKDQWAEKGLTEQDIEGMTGAEKAKHVTKSNVFPRPDYVDLVENNAVPADVAFVLKRMYDRMAASPPGDVQPDFYIKAMTAAREAMSMVKTVEDARNVDDVYKKKFPEYEGSKWDLQRPIRQERTRTDPLRATMQDWRVAERAVKHDNFPYVEPWQRNYVVREHDKWDREQKQYIGKEFVIYPRGSDYPNGGAPEKTTTDTREEAVEIVKAAYEKSNKGRGDEKIPERPHLESVTRTGPDYRKAANVDGQKLIDDFGARGVEFGNWAASDERQAVTNFAHDALNDLARALNLPPKALSLNGTLAIGFGSRGRGGRAAAHYEPGRLVINMTKLSGAGSLAHEWGHALDHHLGEVGTGKDYKGKVQSISGWDDKKATVYLPAFNGPLRRSADNLIDKLFNRDETDEEKAARIAAATEHHRSGIKSWEQARDRAQEAMRKGKNGARGQLKKAEEQIEAWNLSLRRATRESEAKRRETKYYEEAQKLSGKSGKDGYWARPNEMFARAFESYVFDKLAEAGHHSDYLVQGVEPDRFKGSYKGNPYPAGAEREAINTAFDQFFSAIGTAEGKLGPNTRLIGKSDKEWDWKPPAPKQPVTTATPVDTSVPASPDTGTGEMTGLGDDSKAIDSGAEQPAGKRADVLADHFMEYFDQGKSFANILAARKFAADKKFLPDPKFVEEALELAVVKHARNIIGEGGDPKLIYDELTDLYRRQPILGTRTSTSVRDQAYSTPVPLAYLASKLAKIDRDTTVFEPTAGNGALLIGAHGPVIANEINPTRRANLQTQGFVVLDKDAADLRMDPKFEAVIANPPFGAVQQEGNSKVYDLSDIQPGYSTTQIDQAIALRALAAMKDDGHAVLILGGLNKQLTTDLARAQAYNGQSKRLFYKALYDRYNVIDHFTVAGELYSRQGAAWPVDVLVINGRGKSARGLPAVDVPRIYKSWDELKGILDDLDRNNARPVAGANEGVAGGEPGPDVGHGGMQSLAVPGSGHERPDVGRAGVSAGHAGERGGSQAGESGHPVENEPGVGGNTGGPRPETAAVGRPSGLEDFDSAFDDALDAAFGPKEPGPSGVTIEQAREDGALAFARGDDRSPPYPPEQIDPEAAKAWYAGYDDANGTPQEKPAKKTGERAAGPREKPQEKPAEDPAEEAADEAMDSLIKMFGGTPKPRKGLAEGEGPLDQKQYDKVKPLLSAAAKKFADAPDARALMGRMVIYMQEERGMTRDVLERLRPFFKQFMQDVHSGRIKIGEEVKQATQRERPTEKETEGQVSYRTQSTAQGLGTLVPRNMASSISNALEAVEKAISNRYPNIDAYVADQLGFSLNDMGDYLAAEQIDALGLALHNIDKGSGFIIGDQTGIGKGRVNAALIRWALKEGHIPVFVTEKPNLYKDMYRDLTDIGVQEMLGREPRIMMTNAGETVPLNETGTMELKSKMGRAHAEVLNALTADNFRDKHDIVFTTYNQMQTVAGKDTERRGFLNRISPKAVLIFDESHNAGGQEATRKKEGAPLNRAEFARELITNSRGVLYSSATYAKRPDVMDLYSATDMKMAVAKIEDLAEAIQRGGVPMQQAVASMLAEAGQYIRRERSFDGVNYDTVPVKVDQKQYAGVSKTMQLVNEFSKFMKDATAPGTPLWTDLAAQGEVFSHDQSTGDPSVTSLNFTSIMHNLIGQMLLSMKVDPAAKMAIEAIKAGQKPVLTLANTNESFLSDVAEQLGMKKGDALKSDFADMLHKYLERTRTVTVKQPPSPAGKQPPPKKIYLTDAQLGPAGLRAYNEAKSFIRSLDLSSLPVSPIDYLKNKLQQAGYSVGEITGRGMTLDYSGKVPVISARPGADLSIAGRNKTIANFNNGATDALVLNQAGSTGLSAHASSNFKDQRPRKMFIVQAEGNIDTHMQMLGRIHRTGQVVLPSYAQLVADIPAEKRPAAVLAKKMASLNANTTAARGSAVTAKDVPDIMNEYGDQVAASWAMDNPEEHWGMGAPIKISESGRPEVDGAMRKLSGRVMLLDPAKQEAFYDTIEGEYKALMEQMDAAGENGLEAKALDLKAKTFEKTEVVPAKNDSGSPFAAPVIIEKAKVLRLGKPFKPEEVVQKILDELTFGEAKPPEVTAENAAELLQRLLGGMAHRGDPIQQAASKVAVTRTLNAIGAFDRYKRGVLDELDKPEKVEKERAKLDAVKDRWESINGMMSPGARIYIKGASGNTNGVVVKVEQKGTPKNPLALSTWKVTLAIPDASRQTTLPFSRIFETGNAPGDDALAVEVSPVHTWAENAKETLERFAAMQSDAKEDRYIATGNILAAYDWLNKRGQIVHFTDEAGNNRQGVLTARDWNMREHAKSKPRILNTAQEVVDWLGKNKGTTLFSTDNVVRVVADNHSPDYFYLEATQKRNEGGVYYLDKQLTDLTGDFYRRSGTMRVGFDGKNGKIATVIARLQQLGAKFGVPAEVPKAETVTSQRPGLAEGKPAPGTAADFARWLAAKNGPEFRPAAGNPIAREAQDWVRARGEATGDEHLVAIGADGKTTTSRGSDKFVDIPPSILEAMDDPKQSIVLHHNHPGGNGLSSVDMAMLAHPGLSAVWAHSMGGTVTRAALTEAAKARLARLGDPATAERELFRQGTAVGRMLLGPVQRAHEMGAIGVAQGNMIYWHAIAETLARAGVIDYQHNIPDAEALIAAAGLGPHIDRATQAVAGGILNVAGVSTGQILRPARPFEHVGDVGASFDRTPSGPGQYAAQARANRGPGTDTRATQPAPLTQTGGGGGRAPPPETRPPGLAETERPRPGPGHNNMPPEHGLHPASWSIRRKIADILDSDFLLAAKEKLQDFNARVERLQQMAEARSAHWIANDPESPLPDSHQFYVLKRLFPGKRGNVMREFNDKYFMPIRKLIRESGMTKEEASDYLYAKHAPERNMNVGPLHPPASEFYRAMSNHDVVGASGMSTNAARAAVRAMETGPKGAAFRELARRVGDVRRFIQSEMYRGGLESLETLAEWNRTSANYVPLRGWEDPTEAPPFSDQRPNRPAGDVKGPEVKRALGRRTKADNTLVAMIDQAYRTVDRVEKNLALQGLARMVNAMPEDLRNELGITRFRGRPKRVIDAATGLVKSVEDNFDRFRPNAVHMKVGGRDQYLVFADQRMADAIKRWAPDSNAALAFLNRALSKWKSLVTHYNPLFMPRHAARYFVEGLLNAFEQSEHGEFSAIKFATDAFPGIGSATKAIIARERGRDAGELGRHWDEMKKGGGATSMLAMRDYDELLDRLSKHASALGRSKYDPREAMAAITDFVDKYTSVIDNSIRLAAFTQARKQGKTIQQASLIAREATVDYNLRGQLANWLGVWAPFQNVASQTGYRAAAAGMRSKIMRRVFGSVIAMGFAAAAWNYMFGGDDKDKVPYFDKLPEWSKTKSLAMYLGLSDDKGRPQPFYWPFPYNYAAPLTLGYALAGFIYGKAGSAKTNAAMAFKAFVSAFSELGEEGLAWRDAAPELVRPFMDVALNKSWTGHMVHTQPEWQRKPNAESAFPSTPQFWKDVAKFVNKESGGSSNKSGWFDFYPEDIAYIIKAYLGGQERPIENVANVAGAINAGKPIPLTKVPIGSIFYGTDYDQADAAAARERKYDTHHPWQR